MDVLIIEDDSRLQTVLQRVFSLGGYQAVVVGDGQAALELLQEGHFGLAIVDWNLPSVTGIDVVRRIRSSGDQMPIIMLTAHDGVDDRVEGLQAGADDYVVKPFAVKELLARVDAVLRRHTPTASVLSYGPLTLDTREHIARIGDRELELGRVEWKLLHVLMQQPEVVQSRTRLYQEVWGYDFASGSHTLDVHIGYVRKKLEANGEPRLIHTVRGFGYVLRGSG